MNNSTAPPPRTSSSGSPYFAEWSIIVSCIVYTIIAIFAIFGNGLVVGSFIRHQRLRTYTNFFVASLALADMLVGFISVPLWMTFILTYPNHNSSITLVYYILDQFVGITSILHLMVISLERYYAVAYPVRHRNTNGSVYYISLVVVWVVPVVWAGCGDEMRKKYKNEYIIYVFTIFFMFPLLVILAAYGGIWRVVRNRVIPQATQLSSSHKRDMRVIVTIALVIALFVVSWLPFFIINILFVHCSTCMKVSVPPPLHSSHLLLWVKVMHYLNSAVNPICYAVKIPEFRRAFRQLVALCLCCCSKSQPKQNMELFSGTVGAQVS